MEAKAYCLGAKNNIGFMRKVQPHHSQEALPVAHSRHRPIIEMQVRLQKRSGNYRLFLKAVALFVSSDSYSLRFNVHRRSRSHRCLPSRT